MTGQLIFAASEQCADLMYLSGFRAPDAFLWFRVDGKSFMAVWAMEAERARLEAHADIRILNRETLKQDLGMTGEPLTPEELANHHRIDFIPLWRGRLGSALRFSVWSGKPTFGAWVETDSPEDVLP